MVSRTTVYIHFQLNEVLNENSFFNHFFFCFSEDKLLEALCCFERILSINPNFLKSYQNLDNIKHQLVERWHFGMLNDTERNSKYKAAIKKAIQNRNQVSVLDIGTGTGLLALYASENGANNIWACEQSPLMCHLAAKAFQKNGCEDRIKLIPKHSNELNADTDLNGKVDLIVTETMDCGVFGEGLLQTLIHAKEHLLKTTGSIIPGRVKLFIAGFQSRQIAMENNVVNSSSFTDTIYVRNYGLSSNNDEPYDSCHVHQLKEFKLITKSEEALDINLNNLDELYALASGKLKKNIRLAYTLQGSILDGFCLWFEMFLDADGTITVSTDPFCQSSNEQQCCWESAIFRLNHRFTNTQKLQYLNVSVSCTDGILRLDHFYDLYGKMFTEMSPDITKFLNDTEFINRIEYDVFAELKKRSKKTTTPTNASTTQNILMCLENVLDFLPFPTVGIALLKEERLKKLYCSKNAQEFVSFIALSNCIPMTSIVFLDDPADILFQKEQFDLIILPLIDKLGTVISSQIANYTLLKNNKLTSNGFMVPEKIELTIDLIHSNWLRNVTRVTDPEICDRLRIGALINEYSTTLQLDLCDEFTYKCLYGAYRTADVQLNDLFYEIEHKLYLGETLPAGKTDAGILSDSTTIHGILFYFNLTFTKSSTALLSTKRKNSFVRLGCFVCNENEIHRDNGFVTLHYRQNSGVIKIDLK